MTLQTISTTSVTFDSALVDLHISLAHRIDRVGSYVCQVTDLTGVSRRVLLAVTEGPSEGQQLIDCDELFLRDARSGGISVSRLDYLMFVSMGGAGRYEILISSQGDEASIVFDSKAVGTNSVIVISPYVPGAYVLVNLPSERSAKMSVVSLDDIPRADSDATVRFYQQLQDEGALQVALDAGGFSISSIVLHADRPLAVQGSGPMRIVGAPATDSAKGSA